MTAPSAHAIDWRAFIGPPVRRDDDAAFWNWASNLTLDAAYSPTTAIPPTVLATGFNITVGLPAVIHFDDVSSWPSAGGCWIGPGNAAGEIWSYVEFDSLNTGTGYANIIRFDTVDNEYIGTHTIGGSITPEVRFWWPITTDEGRLNLREYVEGNLNGANWRATLRGYNAPLHALRIGHLFLAQTRSYNFGTGAWGDWVNSLVGWIDSVTPADNADGEERWDIEIVSSMGAYGLIEVAGVKVGASEISRDASASASSSMISTYKMFGSGEFVGAAGDVGAGNAVDQRSATPWIADRFVGQTNTPANPGETFDAIATGAKVLISQVHITRYPGQGPGYRWFEITILDDTSLASPRFMYSKLLGTAPDQYMIDYYFDVDLSSYSTGDRIIVAENQALFESENPGNDAAGIVDASTISFYTGQAEHYKLTVTGATTGNFVVTDSSGFVGGTDDSTNIAYNATPAQVKTALGNITATGGRMHVYGSNLPAGPVYIVIEAPNTGISGSPVVRPYQGIALGIKAGWTTDTTPAITTIVEGNDAWLSAGSTGNVAELFDVMETGRGTMTVRTDYDVTIHSLRWGSDGVAPGLGDSALWSSANTVAPSGIPDPQTLRLIYAPTTPSEPADYWQSSQIHTPGYESNVTEWLLIELPRMGLSLAADAYSGATSLLIQSDAGVPSVDGLPGTGTVQIGSEQITYSAINRTTGAISGFTTTAAHSAGDPIYVVSGGIAIDALPVSAISIKRLANVPELEDFVIRVSPYQQVRTPDDASYTTDYTSSVTVVAESGTNYSTATVGGNYVGTWDVSGSLPRIRWILIEITKMATVPYRAAIHEVDITYDTGVFDSGTYLSGVTIGESIAALLDNAGFPSAGYSNSATTDVDGYTTEPGELWPVILDLADFGNKRIVVGRDSKVTITDDALMVPSSADMDGTLPAEAAQLTKDNTIYHEFNSINGRKVGQVELQWKSPDGESEGTAKFPATQDTFGRTEILGPHIYADGTAATYAAARRYWLLRRPHAALWEIAGNGSSHRPLRVYGGTWPWARRTMDRTYLSVGADHELANGAWSTVVQTVQISREDEL